MAESEKTGEAGLGAASLGFVVVFVMVVVGSGLLFWSSQLPFFAGRPLWELFVPVSAVASGVAGFLVAHRAKRGLGRSGWRTGLNILMVLSILIAVAGLLIVLMVLALCGAYWTRTSC